MASEPLRSTTIETAPKDYSIPNAQEIILLSVRAEFIDNGAGGDWLPAFQLLDNNGDVLATASDQGVKVTAGDDAEVSFFPGVKHAAAAAGGLTNLSVAFGRVNPSSLPVVTAGAQTTIPWDSVTIIGDGITFSSGSPRQVTIDDGGTIIVALTVSPSLDWPNTVDGTIKITQNYQLIEPLGVQTIFAGHPEIDAWCPTGSAPGQLTSFAFMSNDNAGANPAHWNGVLKNSTASDFTVGEDTSFAIARVSPWVNF